LSDSKLGKIVGVFSDVHANLRTLNRALDRCAAEGVEQIALLGDLFDRHEQADACATPFAGWDVIGVYGNHERETALAAAAGEIDLAPETIELLSRLQEEVIIDDIRLTHEVEHWGPGHHDLMARLLGHLHLGHGHEGGDAEHLRLTFTGHTHFRQLRGERGTIDIARGSATLDPSRRYLINPGALTIGQYVIWDRENDVVQFRQVEW
jgi:predicted phosphodiesterase